MVEPLAAIKGVPDGLMLVSVTGNTDTSAPLSTRKSNLEEWSYRLNERGDRPEA